MSIRIIVNNFATVNTSVSFFFKSSTTKLELVIILTRESILDADAFNNIHIVQGFFSFRLKMYSTVTSKLKHSTVISHQQHSCTV